MDAIKFNRLFSNKTINISLRCSEELIAVLDRAVVTFNLPSRQSIIETALIEFLESKNLI